MSTIFLYNMQYDIYVSLVTATDILVFKAIWTLCFGWSLVSARIKLVKTRNHLNNVYNDIMRAVGD